MARGSIAHNFVGHFVDENVRQNVRQKVRQICRTKCPAKCPTKYAFLLAGPAGLARRRCRLNVQQKRPTKSLDGRSGRMSGRMFDKFVGQNRCTNGSTMHVSIARGFLLGGGDQLPSYTMAGRPGRLVAAGLAVQLPDSPAHRESL